MTLRGDDGARYLRQRMLVEVADEGQALLDASVVRLVGGSPSARLHAADYLLRAGLDVVLGDEDREQHSSEAHTIEVQGPLTSPAAITPATDLLLGALTAVESIKHVLGVGQPAALPANLFLLGDD